MINKAFGASWKKIISSHSNHKNLRSLYEIVIFLLIAIKIFVKKNIFFSFGRNKTIWNTVYLEIILAF